MTFDGFLSYSHAADGRLAPAVQRGLHRLAKPWHRRRALWIFRDQTGLSVTPGLWSSIQSAIDGSQYFVLLASVEAAQSPWVNREIEHWIATKPADRILPVVTDGEWIWDQAAGDFAEESTAVPPALRGVFSEEPFFLDLRWARGSEHLSLQHSRFRDAIAQLAAPMHGISKDDLEGEDVRQHRRARRLRSGAALTLVVLTLLASITGVSAVRNADRARAAAAEALRQEKAANSQRDNAARSAEEARRQQVLAAQQQELAAQEQTRAGQARAAAEQAERAAAAQQKVAGEATAEARRQRRLADEAKQRKQEQERLAAEAAERAERAQAEAERLAAIAAEQRRLADEAAAEAAKQQAEAERQQRIAVSRRLMNQSSAALVDDPKTALMLGAAAQSINPDTTTRIQFAGAVTGTTYAGTLDNVTAAVFGAAGTLAALGDDGRVSLWNVTDPREPVRLATLTDEAATGTSLAFSGDGRTLSYIDEQGRVTLWDVADRAHPARLATLTSTTTISRFGMSANGDILVTGDAGGTAIVWDTSDRAHPVRFTTLGSSGYQTLILALSPNGRLLYLDRGAGAVGLYDLTDPAHLIRIHVQLDGDRTPLAFSPDGGSVAVGSPNGSVWVYNTTDYGVVDGPIETEPVIDTPSTPTTPSTPSTPVPPGMPTIELDVFPYATLTGPAAPLTSLAYSADGKLLVAGDADGFAAVWDRHETAGPTAISSVRVHGQVNTVSLDPKTGTLVTADGSGTAALWRVVPAGSPGRLATLATSGGQIQATSFSPDGNSLVAAGAAGTASTWNTKDPARPVAGARLTLSGSAVRAVAVSPDHRLVATIAAGAGTLTVADLSKPSRATTLATLPGAKAMAFSPDGRTLAVVAGPTSLMLWDVADRSRPTLTANPTGDFGTAVAFSPDGKTLAVAAAGSAAITLWNIAGRAAPSRLATLVGHSDDVVSLAFGPDGRTLASGSDDGTALLWDVTDRARPLRIARAAGHDSAVTSVAFSPDGHTLAVASTDYTVILWDTTTPSTPVRLATLRTDSYAVARSVTFRSDGRTLAVIDQPALAAPSVTLWNYATLNSLRADPAKYACAVTGRGLTAGEWARYIPEITYRRTC